MRKIAVATALIVALATSACSSDDALPGVTYRCEATDATGAIYTNESLDVVDASNQAMQQCQFNSQTPTTCQSTRCTTPQ